MAENPAAPRSEAEGPTATSLMERRLPGAARPEGPRGVYVHVPFCERRCHYCDFNVQLLREGDVEAYLQAVETEARLYARGPAAGVTFDTLFIGGGTPTALSAGQLERLLAGLRRHLAFAPDAEVTVEANPGTLSPAKLAALRRGGANRISLGAQAFQDHHLERLGRIHRVRHVEESVAKARAAGFDNISLDLMFGLPHQTGAEWEESLERAVALAPEHLSCYSLIVEEDTPFGRLHREGALALPSEDEEAAMYERTIQVLEAAGYRHYEVSNFARPGWEARHNIIYWENGEWLGLGPGAHGQWAGRRMANVRPPDEYARALLAEGRLPIEWEETLGLRVQMEDTLMLGLRLRRGVSLEAFRRRFGVDVHDLFGDGLRWSADRGLVETVGGYLRLTRRGLLLANQVLMRLLETPEPVASR